MKKLLLTLTLVLTFVGLAKAETATITFSDKFSANSTELTDISINDEVSVSFDKGSGSTAPQYYTNGTAVRWYAGNTMTIKASSTITSIEVIFGSSDGTNAISADVGTWSSPNWTGSANTVVFTEAGSSGNRRIAGLNVTYGGGGGSINPDPGTDPEPDPDVPSGPGGTVTFDATAQGYANAQVVSSYSSNPVSFDFAKGSNSNAPTYYTSGTALRCYGGNTITISVPENYIITNITYTFGSGDGTNAITANSGTWSSPNWTGSASNVVFTIGGTSGNKRIQKIEVTYESKGGSLKPAELSFSEKVAIATLNQTFTAPVLNNPNSLPVSYESTNENVATVDGSGNVTILALGSTIIKATSEETTEYYAGNAEYALNVVIDGVYTVAQALEAIKNGFNATATVKGIISQIDDMSNTDSGSTYGNATYWIKDALTDTEALEVYRGYWLDGGKFVTGKEIEVGGTVVVEGTLVNYNGTYEFNSGNKVVSYTAPTTEPEPEVIPDDAFVVYNDGQISSDLNQYDWWEAAWNATAENPLGEGNALEIKSSTAGAGYSMGLAAKTAEIAGRLHDATLHMNWYAVGTATYKLQLTGGGKNFFYDLNPVDAPEAMAEGNWNEVTINIAEQWNGELSEEWNEVTTNDEYVFALVVSDASADAAIYFKNIYYTDVDEDWVAPAVPAPETVPAPEQPADQILSFYSSLGEETFNFGGWGQSTQAQKTEIDGSPVLALGNFNYLGLVDFNINISDYDYMHVDYWTPEENTTFGFVPISLKPETVDKPDWNAETVKANEWNRYDVALSYWENVKMDAIEQLKFIANQNGGSTKNAYIANIYFWKEEKQEEPVVPTEDCLYFEDFEMTLTQGSTDAVPYALEINLNVEEEDFTYQGFQFDITLPDWLAFAQENALQLGEGIVTNNVDYRKLNSGAYRVVVAPAGNQGYQLTEAIITINLEGTWAEGLVAGDYPVSISNVDFSTVLGQDIVTINGWDGTVTLKLENGNPAASIEFGKVTLEEPSYTMAEDKDEMNSVTAGENLNMEITVTGQNPEEDCTDKLTVTTDNDKVTVSENSDGTWTVDTSELEETLEPGQEVTVKITAKAGDVEEVYEITVRGVILGDSNDNGDVTVADAVTTANYIASNDVYRFDFPNANVILNEVDGEQVINVQDVTATINIILERFDGERNPATPKPAKRYTRSQLTTDRLVADDFKVRNSGEFNIGVNLDNSYNYAALQAVVEVPEGMTVLGVKAGPRAAAHQMAYNITEDGKVNVVLFSSMNASFASTEGALFTLVVKASEDCGDLRISDIHASDASSNGYDLGYDGGMNDATLTGVEGIAGEEGEVRYFSVDGLEIVNPEAGQVVIKVCDGKATKVVM